MNIRAYRHCLDGPAIKLFLFSARQANPAICDTNTFFGTFEEINLRFYVKRIEGAEIKRGAVFIGESVPYRPVAWHANRLNKEHYTAIPTENIIDSLGQSKSIKNEWKIIKGWNHITANTGKQKEEMVSGSVDEFTFEHYFGYTSIDNQRSQEYRVNHPGWLVNKVAGYAV